MESNFEARAERGDAEAQYQHACCLALGPCCGNKRDEAEAAEWFRKAAMQGHKEAQNNLGAYYATGTGVEQDFQESLKWFREAARQGVPQSECGLGDAYLSGLGVEQDWAEALTWWRQAAEHGHIPAMLNLARSHGEPDCPEDVAGGPVSMDEAIKWLTVAAGAGDDSARTQLGVWQRAFPEAVAAGA